MQHTKERLKLIAFSLLMFTCLISVCPCNGQTFTGFGNIRIGNTEEEFFSSIRKELNAEILEVTEKNKSKIRGEWIGFGNKSKNKRIYFINYAADVLNWPLIFYASRSLSASKQKDSCRVYFLPEYNLGEISIKNIFVVIKNNRVQLIETDDSYELLKAAKEKYKPTENIDSAHKVKCVYVVSGVPEEKTATQHYSLWKYENYEVEADSGLDYNDKCKTIIWGYIRFITDEMTVYLKKVSSMEEDKESEKERNKLNTLKDKL